MENNHKYGERAAVPQAAATHKKAVRKWQRSPNATWPKKKKKKKKLIRARPRLFESSGKNNR